MWTAWQGLPLAPSLRAEREKSNLHLRLEDIEDILTEGFDCAGSRRAEGTIERCVHSKGRLLKVVVVRSDRRWTREEVWLIIHVGETHEH